MERIIIKKIFVGIIILSLLIVGCSNVQENTELGESIHSTIVDVSNNEISLKSLTDFEWEKAFLFTPYSSEEEIEKYLGVKFNDSSNIRMRDDIYLLVFMNEEKVVQYVEVEHQGVNLTIGEKDYLSPSDDLIIIER
ncbi:hypothetical protein [Ornithinibacillus sp. FSL M8-0202]|uniref:hypothetical protein n=1 Tax=unclassified Ornithinibacillus TaxID=2620869 RepID=UPI0030D2EDE8